MRAVRIYEYGDSQQLKLEEMPSPQIKPDEVLVRIHDAGVNPVDWKIREGYLKSFGKSFPLTMGQDFSGEVLETGSRVRDFHVGDRVFGFARGSYAEFAAIPASDLAPLPDSVSYAKGAALPTAGLTAYQLVMDVLHVSAGERVLIIGAGGGVGTFAVQLCLWRKSQVIAVGGPDDRAFLEKLGISQFVDYKTERFENVVRDVDAVIDLVGGDSVKRAYQCLREGGILASTVGPVTEEDARQHRVRGVQFIMKHDGRELATLAKLADGGLLEPRMGPILPLSEAAKAQDLLKSGQTHGKVVLQIM